MAATFGMHDATVEIDDGSGSVRQLTEATVLCRLGRIEVRTATGALLASAVDVASAVRGVGRGPRRFTVTLASGPVWTVTQGQRRCLSCQ